MRSPKVSLVSRVKLSFEVNGSQDWRNAQQAGSGPVFLASQEVYGRVHINYRDTTCYRQGDVLQVKLLGTYYAESWIANHPCTDSRARKIRNEEILNMTHAFKVKPPCTDESIKTLHDTIKFSFRACERTTPTISFGSPDTTFEEEFEALGRPVTYKYLRSIPSSTQTRFTYPCRTTTNDDSHLEVRITYKLQAFLLRAETFEEVAHTDLEITILDDSNSNQPPICTADFASEYCLRNEAAISLSQTQDLVRKFRGRCVEPPRLLLAAIEPKPLVFDKSKQYATTIMAVTCTYIPSHQDDCFGMTPSTAVVTWQMQKSTFSSFNGLERPPSLKDVACKKKAVVQKVIGGKSKTYKCGLVNWQEGNGDEVTWGQTGATESEARNSSIQTSGAALDLSGKVLLPGRYALLNNAPLYHQQVPNIPSTHLATTRPPDQRVSKVTLDNPSIDVDLKGVSDAPTRSTTIQIPVEVLLATLPSPTSFTSYIAVRYSLNIHIRAIREKDSAAVSKGAWHLWRTGEAWAAETNLQVPIQVVYELGGSNAQFLGEGADHVGCTTGESTLKSLKSYQIEGGCQMEELPSYAASMGIA